MITWEITYKNVANKTMVGVLELPIKYEIINPKNPEAIENMTDKNKYCFILFEIFFAAAAGNVKRELISKIPIC